jgi:ATP-dependent DNA helicase RecG
MPSPTTVERALEEPASTVGQRLLAALEDQWFDRKSARIKPRALGDAIVGFANAEGGIVVVGLSDGRVEGTDKLGPRLNELVQAPFDYAVPPVRVQHRLVACVDDDGAPDHLLVFEVAPSEGLVHANGRDEVYLRLGDENRRLTFAQRQELAFDRGPGSYESRPIAEGTMRDLDRDLLDAYVADVGASSRKRLLRARGLLSAGGAINVAGWLLFARHPQAQVPEAFVRVVRHRGIERSVGAGQRIVDDERCEGPIPQILTRARALVQSLQPTRRGLGRQGRFEDIPLVPEDAWLEGIVNAVVHRSYSLAGDHIRVEVFDDRIEITSPGRFPGIVDLADPLDAPRFARNPRIARVCADLRFGEELGEGIRRIYEEMRYAGLGEPVYVQTTATVRLVLSGQPVDRALEARLPPEARAITLALRDAGRLRTGEVAELLGRSRPVAIARLRALENAGVVLWVGRSPADPHAYWQLVR